MIIDVRESEKDKYFRYDHTDDLIYWCQSERVIKIESHFDGEGRTVSLTNLEDFDNFIKACKLAYAEGQKINS